MNRLINKINEKQMAWSGYSIKKPDICYFVINNICNLKCTFCDIGQNNKESSFSKILARPDKWITDDNYPEVAKVLSEIAPIIHINSTEPILEKNIFKFVKELKKLGKTVYITTNGSLFKKRMDELLESGLDRLYVSIDGTKEEHDNVRGMDGLYDQLLWAIKHIKENSKCEVIVPSVVTNENYATLYDHACKILDLGVDGFYVSHLSFIHPDQCKIQQDTFPQYPGTPTYFDEKIYREIDYKILHEQLEKIKSLTNEKQQTGVSPDLNLNDIEKYYTTLEPLSVMKTCKTVGNNIQILANGDLIPMTRCTDSIVFGNLKNESFSAIWNGEKLQNFRKIIKKELMPICYRCGGAY